VRLGRTSNLCERARADAPVSAGRSRCAVALWAVARTGARILDGAKAARVKALAVRRARPASHTGTRDELARKRLRPARAAVVRERRAIHLCE
jgi:hypothetical protein